MVTARGRPASTVDRASLGRESVPSYRFRYRPKSPVSGNFAKRLRITNEKRAVFRRLRRHRLHPRRQMLADYRGVIRTDLDSGIAVFTGSTSGWPTIRPEGLFAPFLPHAGANANVVRRTGQTYTPLAIIDQCAYTIMRPGPRTSNGSSILTRPSVGRS